METYPNDFVRYIDGYITHRRQKVKINSLFHEQKKVGYDVPPRSILSLLLCNSFICDSFFDNIDIAADDITNLTFHRHT